jgi:hypothetical protein
MPLFSPLTILGAKQRRYDRSRSKGHAGPGAKPLPAGRRPHRSEFKRARQSFRPAR